MDQVNLSPLTPAHPLAPHEPGRRSIVITLLFIFTSSLYVSIRWASHFIIIFFFYNTITREWVA